MKGNNYIRKKGVEDYLYLVLVFCPILLLLPILIKGKVLYWGTPTLQFIPWRVLAWQIVNKGVLPFWNPFNGLGAPLLANYQLAFFYPPSWLLYLFAYFGGGEWISVGYTLLIIIHLIWVMFGSVFFMRQLRFSKVSQIVSAIAFGLSGALIARLSFFNMIWVISWLPWVMGYCVKMLSGEVIWEEKDFSSWIDVPLAVCFSLMFLAGHAQLSWYVICFSTLFVIAFCKWNDGIKICVKRLLRYINSGFIGAAVAAPQLLPTFEYLIHSQRSSSVDYELAMTYSFWPWRILTFLMPNIFGNPGLGNYWGYANYWEDANYIGVFSLLLAISTFFIVFNKSNKVTMRHRRIIIFFWLSIVVLFILALGKNTPIYPLLYRHVPTFNLFNAPSRYMIIVDFSLSVLAGIGFEYLDSPKGKALYWTRLLTVGTIAILIGSIVAKWGISNIHNTFIQAAMVLSIFSCGTGVLLLLKPSEGIKKIVWNIVVVIWLALDLLVASIGLNPGITKNSFLVDANSQYLIADNLDSQRVYLQSKDEYTLKFDHFFSFIEFIDRDNLDLLRHTLLPNTNILEKIYMVNNFDPLVPNRFANMMELLPSLTYTERYVWLNYMDVAVEEIINVTDESLVEFILRDADNSRYWWFSCADFVSVGDEAWRKVNGYINADYPDIPLHIVIEDFSGEVPSNICSTVSEMELISYDIGYNRETVRLSANQDGWLMFSKTWYPGWLAKVDGKRVPLYRANYLFQAVYMEKGDHLVELAYTAPAFYAGAVICVIAIICLLYVYFVSK